MFWPCCRPWAEVFQMCWPCCRLWADVFQMFWPCCRLWAEVFQIFWPCCRLWAEVFQMFWPCCRLWAEVFHVSSTGSGTVKWQQISDDLVPVSLTCIQDSPSYVFHITAYNSQVDKILDVRLTQPGEKLLSAVFSVPLASHM